MKTYDEICRLGVDIASKIASLEEARAERDENSMRWYRSCMAAREELTTTKATVAELEQVIVELRKPVGKQA